MLTPFFNAYPDTSIQELSQYMPRNFMGNTGLPSPLYLLRLQSNNLGFRLYEIPYANDRFSDNQVEYHTALGPYASLQGIAGDKQLQMFRLFFTNTYYKRLNISLRFNRNTSLGFYKKQQTFTNNFYFSSNYSSKNQRAGYYAYLINNGNRHQENGGLKAQLNDSTVALNKDLLRVRLDSSSRDNRELQVMMNPWWRLNPGSDSLNQLNHYLQLKSCFSSASYKYKSGDSYADKFYNAYYFDSINAVDSTHVRQIANSLLYTLRGHQGRLAFSAGYRHELNALWQRGDSTFTNQFLLADLSTTRRSSTSLDQGGRSFTNVLRGQYAISGPNSGNYKLENTANWVLHEQQDNRIYFKANAENRSQDYIGNYWKSNHFSWQGNNYKSTLRAEAEAGFAFRRMVQFSALYQNIFRMVYFDNNALPRQYNKTVQNIAISLTGSKVFFKHLGVALAHTFQSTSHPAYVRIPAHVTSGRLYYTGVLFKKSLQLQLGAQAQVFQSFTGYAYSPATQAFYLTENYHTAAMPLVDAYLHARVKPVTIFIRMENVLKGVAGVNYSFVQGYYQTDRALRFGITWVFFD